MIAASTISEWFSQALAYEPYLATGKEEHQRRWQQVYERAAITPAQRQLLAGFTRDMNALVLSGTWCGDCVQQVPLMQRLAEANPAKIRLKIIDRDIARPLMQQVRINAGDRVPTVIFAAEDFEFCALAGDRALSRYRAIAQRQLGAACATGIVPPEAEEMAATLQDWLDEFERVQLMLRLSPRLRKKYGD